MRSLRIYRVLLPGLLAVVVVLLVLELKPLGDVHSQVGPSGELQLGSSALGVTATDWDGDRKQMEIAAASIQRDEQGRIQLDEIRELKLFRNAMLPLVIQALSGDISGEKGSRIMVFDRGVTLDDPERGLRIRIPGLVFDEAAREARASSRVELEGDGMSGAAENLVYRIDGQPANLTTLTLANQDGGELSADYATLYDGLDDVELTGRVRAERGQERLVAEQLRVVRRDDGSLVSATASGNVSGAAWLAPGELVRFAGDSVATTFDGAGDPGGLDISGAARIERGPESIAADTLRARRGNGEWRIEAEGGVELQGALPDGDSLLRAGRLEAVVGPLGILVEAEATGRVTFDAPNTRAESQSATFGRGKPGEIALIGTARRKARLARDETRVAAVEIRTDANGSRLLAERAVEATLLPAPAGMPDLASGPFRAGEPIHFVAETLEGQEASGRLVFTGQVRGWQGERNLSSDRMTLDRDERGLVAEGNVAGRFPRRAGSSVSESDYIQITSETLEYSDTAGIGVFRGSVRVHLVEGWMEADRVEFESGEGDGAVREIRGIGQVRLEFRQSSAEGPPKVIAGAADRVVYSPAEESVWLIGEAAPATVRRIGENRGTTTGRVLRYRLGSGTLEVESGKIQTGR